MQTFFKISGRITNIIDKTKFKIITIKNLNENEDKDFLINFSTKEPVDSLVIGDQITCSGYFSKNIVNQHFLLFANSISKNI